MTTNKSVFYRYPGTKPFEADESELFKGRDEDIRNLSELISLQNLVVLFGRSGLGKSSLLNAGLVTCFQHEPDTAPVFLRFGAYYDKNATMPLERLHHIFYGDKQANSSNFIYEKLIPKEEITLHHLWYAFKSYQIAHPDKQKMVLIFDQFEELFTYPEKEIDLFKKELSELLYVSVPQQLRNLLKAKLLFDPAYLSKEEKDALFRPLNVKILFSIRSDKLSLLNNLTDYFPSVLKWCYELKALNPQQACQSIEEPAGLEDKKYASPPFTFTAEAIRLLLNTLTEVKANKEDKAADYKQEIETFQLQIICKYAENVVMERGLRQITASDLGNIKEIFENHYRNIIARLAPGEQLPARRLMEEKLIIDGNRVSMPIPFILRDEGMTPELLDRLIDTHILRREQNNTVEISHDTLVEPVLRYYEERKKEETIARELREKEEQLKIFREEQEKELEAQRLKAKRNRVLALFISVALILTLGFAAYALNLSHEANKQKQLAEKQKQEADRLRSRAEKEKKEAETSKVIALKAEDQARESAFRANRLAEIAKSALKEADKQKQVAIQKAIEAEKQAEKARIAREQIERQKDGFRLILRAHEEENEDPTVALRLAEAAIQKFRDPLIINEAQHIYQEHTFYKIVGDRGRYALSPDGTGILAPKYSGVKLLNSKGEEQKLFGTSREGYENGYAASVTFSPDGNRFLIGLHNGTAELWKTDSTLIRLKGHKGMVLSAAFSPDGEEVLTGSEDSTAILWNTRGDSLKTFKGHKSGITSVAFSPDKQEILTGSSDSTVRVWKREDDSYRETKEPYPIQSVAFPTSKLVLIGSSGSNTSNDRETGSVGVVTAWNLNFNDKGSLLKDFKKQLPLNGARGISSIAFTKDGSKILTGSDDGVARVWSSSGDLLRELKGHAELITSVAFSADGTTVLTSSSDNTTRLWNLKDLPVKEYREHASHINLVAFSPDKSMVLTGSDDSTARLWSIDGALLKVLKDSGGSVSSVDFSHDGKNILTAATDGTAKLWDTSGRLLHTFKGHTAAVQSVAFSKNKTKVLTGSDDGTALLWTINGDSITTFTVPDGSVTSVAFSPVDSTKILVGSWQGDDAAFLWNTKSGQWKAFKKHKGGVIAIAFSPDGQKILTGSEDQTAILWNVDGDSLKTFKGHTDRVWSVAFSPDGTKVITGSIDGTARVWNLNGELLRVINGHEDGVSSAIFSPDGTKILTASWDKTAKLWSSGRLLTLDKFLENGLIDELTEEQKAKFEIK